MGRLPALSIGRLVRKRNGLFCPRFFLPAPGLLSAEASARQKHAALAMDGFTLLSCLVTPQWAAGVVIQPNLLSSLRRAPRFQTKPSTGHSVLRLVIRLITGQRCSRGVFCKEGCRLPCRSTDTAKKPDAFASKSSTLSAVSFGDAG